jgi:hypothetical protein
MNKGAPRATAIRVFSLNSRPETRSKLGYFPWMTFDTWQFHQGKQLFGQERFVGLPGKISQFHSAGFEGSVA